MKRGELEMAEVYSQWAKCGLSRKDSLCVGHDSLFLKYSEAMRTVCAVKDQVTGHNPLAAIYTLDTVYSRLKADP